MATQKPISTISYNSESFLREKLEIWYAGHIISAYQYICHKGEDGDKDHIHVRIEPNKKLDPMALQEELREFTINNDKPLCCRPFRPSKEEDWFLYAVHDPTYLKLKYGGGDKGEKLPYSWEQIVVPEYYDKEIAFIRAKASMEHTTVNLATRLQNGTNALDLVLQGENPYVVNSIMHTLAKTDYSRLLEEYRALSYRFNTLCESVMKLGWAVSIDENGVCSVDVLAADDIPPFD